MDSIASVEAIERRGLAGNADQGGKRQITLIDEARWREAEAELGTAVDPSARRANVMLRGIDLEATRGRTLRIGGCLVRIYNETRPCYQMDQAFRGLQAALSPRWRAGACGEIVQSGLIAVGDRAEWLAAPADSQQLKLTLA